MGAKTFVSRIRQRIRVGAFDGALAGRLGHHSAARRVAVPSWDLADRITHWGDVAHLGQLHLEHDVGSFLEEGW